MLPCHDFLTTRCLLDTTPLPTLSFSISLSKDTEESLPLLDAAVAEARRAEAADGGASPSSRTSSPGPGGEPSPSAAKHSDAVVAAAEAAARQAYRKQLLGLGLYAVSTMFGTGMSLCAKASRGRRVEVLAAHPALPCTACSMPYASPHLIVALLPVQLAGRGGVGVFAVSAVASAPCRECCL